MELADEPWIASRLVEQHGVGCVGLGYVEHVAAGADAAVAPAAVAAKHTSESRLAGAAAPAAAAGRDESCRAVAEHSETAAHYGTSAG